MVLTVAGVVVSRRARPDGLPERWVVGALTALSLVALGVGVYLAASLRHPVRTRVST